MGYRFAGYFTRTFAHNGAHGDAALIHEAQRQWPGCAGQVLATPCAGIVVHCSDPEREADAEADDRARAIGYRIEDELPAWSARFPSVRFVFVAVECFGGMCLYRGFVCQNRQIEAAEPSQPRGAGALARLMVHLRIELAPDEHFAPFERTFLGRGGERTP